MKFNTKRKSKSVHTLLLIIGIILVTFGCSSPSTPSPETTIKDVLGIQFSGPEQELKSLLNSPDNITNIGEEDSSSKQNNTTLEIYLEDKYKVHFTDIGYEKFIGVYALTYHSTASDNNVQMEVDNIKIEQSEQNENIYDFTIEVNCIKDDLESVATVTGRTHMTENKIGKFEILEDAQLIDLLNE